MAQLKVDTQWITAEVGQLSAISGSMNTYSESIGSISKALQRNKGSFVAPICGRLDLIREEVLNEAAKMDSLAAALRAVTEAYIRTERALAQLPPIDVPAAAGEADSDRGEEEVSPLQRFINWLKKLFGWEEKEPVEVTRQQEKEHDLYMQREIFDLLDTDRFSRETWNNATVEERKAMLQAFLVELAAIYGVTVSTNVSYFQGDGSTRGQYRHSDRSVHINENYLSRADSYQIMQTMIHEMRHAYQHSAVDHPENYQVSAETIAQWKDNFQPGHYKTVDKDGYEAYVSQPIEYDAKNFAKQYSDLENADPVYEGSWGE